MKKIVCIVVLINILWNISSGSTYRCYECQEEKGKGLDCESNVKNVLQPNCTESFHCIKYIWASNNSSVISRGCAPISKCIELKATVYQNHTLEYCALCDTPLCNSAPTSLLLMPLWSSLISFILICTRL